jgi:hypothetical protein
MTSSGVSTTKSYLPYFPSRVYGPEGEIGAIRRVLTPWPLTRGRGSPYLGMLSYAASQLVAICCCASARLMAPEHT